MSVLDGNIDIKFRLANYYTVTFPRYFDEKKDLLIPALARAISDVELDVDYKIHTKRIRAAVRNILGEKYCVKRISLFKQWKFECILPEEKPFLYNKLWNISSYVEFYIDKEIKLN